MSTIAAQYQSVLSANGQANKPIYLGEYGVNVKTNTVNDTQQQALIQGVMSSTGPIAVADLWDLRDYQITTCCPPVPYGEYSYYGLVQHDDATLKQGYYTLQRLIGGQGSPPPTSNPTPPPPSVAPPKPTPSPAAATPTPVASPTPTPSPTASQPTTGNTTSGSSGTSGSSAQPLTVAALSKGGPRLLYFAVLLMGLAGLGVGLALATNVGALATARLTGARLRRSIQGHRPMGVVVATCGGILCLAAILLLNVLPRSG